MGLRPAGGLNEGTAGLGLSDGEVRPFAMAQAISGCRRRAPSSEDNSLATTVPRRMAASGNGDHQCSQRAAMPCCLQGAPLRPPSFSVP